MFHKRSLSWYNIHMQKSLKPIDLSKILLPFENKWVALSENYKKILASGKTLKEVTKKVNKSGEKGILLKVPPFDVSFVPTTR